MKVLFDRYQAVTRLPTVAGFELYRGFDPQLRRHVSLRVQPAGPFTLPGFSHPCIRVVLEVVRSGERLVVVEEEIEGEALDIVLERGDLVPMADRVDWLVCLADALSWAHQEGIVHGALTPAWITISAVGGKPALSGLGLGSLLGRGEAEAAADAFAFGVIAYELLTGHHPFPGKTADQALAADLLVPPTPIPHLEPDCPPAVAEAVHRCLDDEPDRRNSGLMALARLAEVAEEAPAESPLEALAPLYDENVQFTVYRPHAVASEMWSRMLFFAHLDALPGDATEDAEDPLERVERTAREVLGEQVSAFRRSVQDGLAAVPREGEITVSPQMAGVRFNPPSITFLWLESVHWHEFRLWADRRLAGSTARGRITVFHGAILLAEIPLTFAVDRPEALMPSDRVPSRRVTARPYRHIFPSYSHRDTSIVEQAERYAAGVGDTYLRDVIALRAGELWNDRLLELIEQADVFQLFWSNHAMHSRFVEKEWRHALTLRRPHFVRPSYWEQPLPEDAEAGLPPPELRELHFHFLGQVVDDGEARAAEAAPAPFPRTWVPAPAGLDPARRWSKPPALAAALVVFLLCVAVLENRREEGEVDLSSESSAEWDLARGRAVTIATVRVLPHRPDAPPTGADEVVDLHADQAAEILALVSEHPEAELEVAGHAAGGELPNEISLALGERRAFEVRDQLIALGVPPEKLHTLSYGEMQPVCVESTEACRRVNERVEIIARLPTRELEREGLEEALEEPPL